MLRAERDVRGSARVALRMSGHTIQVILTLVATIFIGREKNTKRAVENDFLDSTKRNP